MLQSIKIGMAATGQLSFPGDKESVFKRDVEGMKKLGKELGFEFVFYPEIIMTESEALKARNMMENEKIDFLLVHHTSYTPGNVGMILTRIKDSYVGYWAIPEGADSGVVPFNSLCSINMHMGITSHYLKKYGIGLPAHKDAFSLSGNVNILYRQLTVLIYSYQCMNSATV
jgi:hypothetical protein